MRGSLLRSPVVVVKAMWRIPLVFFLSWVSLASAAAAAPLRLRDLGSVRGDLVSTDGERYITVSDRQHPDRPPRLLDGLSLREVELTPPDGCDASFGIYRQVVTWRCGNAGATTDLRTGAVRRLPAPDASDPAFVSAEFFYGYAITGRYWAAYGISGYHWATQVYLELATGRWVLPHEDVDHVIDLDSRTLTRRLCGGQRRLLGPSYSGIGPDLSPLITAGRWAAGLESTFDLDTPVRSRLELQRCGGRRVTLDRVAGSTTLSAPVFASGRVAWTRRTTRPMTSKLVVRSLSNGLVRVASGSSNPPLQLGNDILQLRGRHLFRVVP